MNADIGAEFYTWRRAGAREHAKSGAMGIRDSPWQVNVGDECAGVSHGTCTTISTLDMQKQKATQLAHRTRS